MPLDKATDWDDLHDVSDEGAQTETGASDDNQEGADDKIPALEGDGDVNKDDLGSSDDGATDGAIDDALADTSGDIHFWEVAPEDWIKPGGSHGISSS